MARDIFVKFGSGNSMVLIMQQPITEPTCIYATPHGLVMSYGKRDLC